MTDPAGVAQDPRPALMMSDEPDTVAALMALADKYADAASWNTSGNADFRRRQLEAAIRAALEAQ